MPELPEVETIRRQLKRLLVGKIILHVEVRLVKIVSSDGKRGDVVGFVRNIHGRRIERVERRAKILILTLDRDWTLLVHLKLTGQFIYGNSDHPLFGQYTHVVCTLSDGSLLFFNDQRQFGYLKLMHTANLWRAQEVRKLGPEPLDRTFSFGNFLARFAGKRSGKIKPVLMDQSFIAGLGNIYSDEVLFQAGVRPIRDIKGISGQEFQKIYDAMRVILKESLRYRGASADAYVDAYGERGGFVPHLRVYGRGGEPCRVCGTRIEERTVGGRTAHFCPHCQK